MPSPLLAISRRWSMATLLGVLAVCWPATAEQSLAAEMRFLLVPFGDPAKCGENCPLVITAEGEIKSDTPKMFLEFVGANLKDPRVRSIVFLHSQGGGVDASMRLGRMFRKTGVMAIVGRISQAKASQGPAINLPGARCMSACVYAFMGAKKRIIPPSSQVGIARMFFYEKGTDGASGKSTSKRTFGSPQFVAALAEYASEMGVSKDLVYMAEKVDPDKPYIITISEMEKWGLGEQNNSIADAAPPSHPISPSVAVPPTASSKNTSGSAFRIANGQFLTNHHVINGCNGLTVGGKLGGRILASDQTRDLALVSIDNDSGPIASMRTTRVQLNEPVTAAGFPLDGIFSGISVTNGTISRLSGLGGDTGTIQISAPIQPGNSGGPLLDVAGNVIGVVRSQLDDLKMVVLSGSIPQNVNFAINGSSLRAFLDAKNVNYKEVGNERELTGVQIAARASAFTVLIECQR